jgi:citrate synthase
MVRSGTAVPDLPGATAYRGHAVADLIRFGSFEETCSLLLAGDLPTAPELADFRVRLAANRPLPAGAFAWLSALPGDARTLDVLRGLVGGLVALTPRVEGAPLPSRAALHLIATMPTLVASWSRVRRGLVPLEPLPALSTAGNLLYLRAGRAPDPDAERALDALLVAFAERGVDAATTAARAVAGLRGDPYASTSAALAVAANDPASGVERAALALATAERPAPFDLAEAPGALAAETSAAGAEAVAARILVALGFAPDECAGIVACARVAGWSAHALEAVGSASSAPLAYVGPSPRPWTPLDARAASAFAKGSR